MGFLTCLAEGRENAVRASHETEQEPALILYSLYPYKGEHRFSYISNWLQHLFSLLSVYVPLKPIINTCGLPYSKSEKIHVIQHCSLRALTLQTQGHHLQNMLNLSFIQQHLYALG